MGYEHYFKGMIPHTMQPLCIPSLHQAPLSNLKNREKCGSYLIKIGLPTSMMVSSHCMTRAH